MAPGAGMNTNTAPKRLEDLQKIVRAACDTEYTYPSEYTRGITTGLRIALDAIEAQLTSARRIEAASQNQ
jgi:hypothetical protein